MKIEKKSHTRTMDFEILDTLDVFEFNGLFYLKLPAFRSEFNDEYNAVELNDTSYEYFKDNDPVIFYDSCLIIEN